MQLQGKTALVTGAASGFGAEIARRYVQEGARVAILDLNGEGAKKVAQECGSAAMAFTADVTKLADVESAVRETVAVFGRLDIVVNNAGWTHRNKSLLEVTEAEFDRVFPSTSNRSI